MEGSNHRCINKMLVSQVLPTCQLQMGMTELKLGSVWNTMPVSYTHLDVYKRQHVDSQSYNAVRDSLSVPLPDG